MSSRRLGGVLAVALTAAAASLFPVASNAAEPPITPVTPITIGQGYNASVTVDGQGTGHIAYLGNESNTNSLHYCTLPRFATSCTVNTTVPAALSSTSLEHPFVVVNGNTIQIVSYRYGFSVGTFGQDIVYTSTDGGNTWDNGVSAGQNPFHLAILGPGNAVSTITIVDSADGGTIYQRVPLDGTSAGNSRANLSTANLGDSAVGLLDANTPIAVMDDGNDNAFWRRFTGGDPNNAGAWSPETPVGGVSRNPHFAYGPNGVFLVGGDSGFMKSRRWNGNGFDAGVTIPSGASGGETPQAFASQDPSGRIHVTFPQITANCCKVLYATSDDGAHWASRQFQLGTDLPGQTQVAAAPDHVGFATWHTGSPRTVFALPVGPSAAVPTPGKYAGVAVVSGVVLVRVPGSSNFVPLRGGDVIPVGSLVDATKGRVRVTIALPGGKLQSTDFFQGVFRLTQVKSGLATMALAGGNFKVCGRSSSAATAAKVKVVRHLWGEGKGKFRTKGRFAAAAIRGTTWNTIDRCDGTQVKVTKGKVAVTDFKKHKTVVLKAGQSYLAKK